MRMFKRTSTALREGPVSSPCVQVPDSSNSSSAEAGWWHAFKRRAAAVFSGGLAIAQLCVGAPALADESTMMVQLHERANVEAKELNDSWTDGAQRISALDEKIAGARKKRREAKTAEEQTAASKEEV